MLLTLHKYTLKVTYKPGKKLFLADALSRAYLKEQEEELLGEELEVNWVTPQLLISEEKLEVFRKTIAEDLQKLRDVTVQGWPDEKTEVSEEMQKYWTFKEEINYASGLLFKNAKLIVLNHLRQEMLNKIHESHLGIMKCKERARDILYWPGISTLTEKMGSQCPVCNKKKKSNPRKPLIPHALPGRPWEKIGTDLFHHNGAEFLLCDDYCSKYPEIQKLSVTTS